MVDTEELTSNKNDKWLSCHILMFSFHILLLWFPLRTTRLNTACIQCPKCNISISVFEFMQLWYIIDKCMIGNNGK